MIESQAPRTEGAATSGSPQAAGISLRLDVRVADDLAPFRRLEANALGERLRRAHDGKDEIGCKELLPKGWIVEDALCLRIELAHDVLRRAFGRGQSVPWTRLRSPADRFRRAWAHRDIARSARCCRSRAP